MSVWPLHGVSAAHPDVNFLGVEIAKASFEKLAYGDPTNPAQASLIFSSLHQILNNDDEKYAYADAERKLEIGPLQSIKFRPGAEEPLAGTPVGRRGVGDARGPTGSQAVVHRVDADRAEACRAVGPAVRRTHRR